MVYIFSQEIFTYLLKLPKIIGFIFKIIIYTGFWLFVLLGVALDWIITKLLPISVTRSDFYETTLLVIAAIPMLFIFVQNIIRTITRNSSFSLLAAVTGSNKTRKEKRAVAPKAAKELLSPKPEGFIFGKQARNYAVKPTTRDGHILVIGGAGSGKSSCIAIPSLLAWNERVFAIDIKGELAAKTQNKRPNAKVFNPLDHSAFGYNPFYILRNSPNVIQDVREIALSIIPLPPNTKDPFWIESAQNLFTGALLYYYNRGYSFIQAIQEIQSLTDEDLVNEIYENDKDARLFVSKLINLDAKTLGGISTSMANQIMIFATDSDIKAALNKSNIVTPEDLENGLDVFISMPEHKLEQWKNLLSLIVNQFLKHFERRPDNEATPVLFLLDEFARLGKIESVVNGLATLRSKKITITILTQSLAQLDVIYGKEQRQVIADNCQFKAILNATDADTQEYFSKLVGTYDKTKKTDSANFEQFSGVGKGTGVSKTTEEKRKIKPEDFATLTDIVLLTPVGFSRVDKTPYYEDKIFKQLAN